jgi:hypothetical protein
MSMRATYPSDRGDIERDLVDELACTVLQRVAPEELVVFDETAADYSRDPELVLNARRRDEAVGFGLEMALLTPYVLAVGTVVVRFLGSIISDAVRDEIRDELKPVIAGPVRRLFRREGTPQADRGESAGQDRAPGVTAEQAREVRRVALQQARRSGLDDDKASLLADAFVGALLVNG